MITRLTDALNAREAALRVFDATLHSRYRAHYDHQRAVGLFESTVAADRAIETLAIDLQMLKEAACFVWAPDLIAAVAQSAKSLPENVAFDRSWLHALSGFWWFGPESPLRAHAVDDTEARVRDTVVHAMAYAWRPERNAVIIEAFTMDTWDIPEGRLPMAKGPRPFYGEQWAVGRTMEGMYHDVASLHETARRHEVVAVVGDLQLTQGLRRIGLSTYMMNAHALLPFFAAAGLWLSQRICVDHPEPAERHARKRAVRAGANPEVRVVRLRRADYRQAAELEHTASEGEGRTFTVQWVVRGHWRNQWYRTANAHRPIWIDPYSKGDPSHPLKTSTTLFTVDR